MTDIRATVRLRNAMDEMLARRGMLRPDQVRTCEVEAAVDTESVRCFIPGAMAERLGLEVRGRRAVQCADGSRGMAPLTGPILFEIFGRDTVEEAVIFGDDVRMGYTVLAKLDLGADD